jgi:Predicted transcriptional regulators
MPIKRRIAAGLFSARAGLLRVWEGGGEMYKIGEFSRITRLTVKALRYYDEEGLLRPSCRAVDLYRYYDEGDFERARLLVLLRGLDFSIPEIREILANCGAPEDLPDYLREKQEILARRIARDRERLGKISLFLKPEKQRTQPTEDRIEVKRLAPLTVLTVRFKGRYGDMGRYIGGLYRQAKDKADGAPFRLCYDDDYKEEADIALCLPTRGLLAAKNAEAGRLPPVTAVCITHRGGYDTLNLTYKAALDFARARRLTCLPPSREIYIKGPGTIFKGSPSRYLTEIAVPVGEE